MYRKILFKTFTEFCDRADEILDGYYELKEKGLIKPNEYKRYIYEGHKFSENGERDTLVKDKCWCWILSREYETMAKNDLFCVLGQLKKGE